MTPTEIERKFLVSSDDWEEHADEGVVIEQGYLMANASKAVRVRRKGALGFLTIKSGAAAGGLERMEFEYEIPLEHARALLEHLCEPGVISKTRYHVRYEGHLWEVDRFAGENAGLIVAEIELEDEDEVFAKPAWLGEEVSHDPRYLNARLATSPYSTWS